MKKKLLLIFILTAVICGIIITLSNEKLVAKTSAKAKSKLSDCSFNGFNLYGKVQVVNAFPDIKVQIVNAFPDLKVQIVDAFPDACGKWQMVDAFPDFKIQFVDAFPDIKIQYVDAFPGLP
ncbi:MAG: hypothetical protein ABR968_06655 [Bacteroidales bacterium]|jgi:hypothetical protein